MKISTPTLIDFLKLAALLLLCTTFAAPQAYAQAIKMLPPTNCPFVTQAQIAAGASNVWGVLGWDSKNPLSCVPNFQFSDNGYTGIGSAGAQPQALLDLYGDYDYTYPTPGLTHLGNVHMDPTDNVAPTNDGWSTALTFGGDNGYDASAEAGIYVQYSNAAYANGSPGTKMYFGTTNNYATGAQIHMTIDNNGFVGIGTTAPTTPLQIRAAAGEDIVFRGPVSAGSGTEIGSVNDENSAWEPLQLDGSVTILGMGGNVGIGTTAPTTPLQIRAAAGEDIVFRGPVSAGSGTEIGSVNDENSAWEPLQLDGSVTILGMGGNVGIGATSPIGTLDVENGADTATICLNGVCRNSWPGWNMTSLVTYGGYIGNFMYCAFGGGNGEYVTSIYPNGGSAGNWAWYVSLAQGGSQRINCFN